MAFRFPLQAVLRLRRSLENQEEKKLMAIVSAIAKVRKEIEMLDEAGIEQRRRGNDALVSGVSVGAMLQFSAFTEVRRLAFKTECAKRLAELELKRKAQVSAYGKARQKREILESLRDREQARYDMEWAKNEQERLDEVFLIRKMREETE
jgi:flagellar export protein FliJ